MHKSNNSYFTRHKNTIKLKPNKPSTPALSDLQVHRSVADRTASPKEDHKSLLQEKSEQQRVYEEYKEIQARYNQELRELEEDIARIKKQTENEIKKIRQAETSLENKKKELKHTKQRYYEACRAAESEEAAELSEAKILQLEEEIMRISEQNLAKIKALSVEEQQAKEENEELKKKLAEIEADYQKHLAFDYSEFEQQKALLEEEEQSLKKELQDIEAESLKIKKDIERIQSMKPVSGEVHKKYLDLFEKMFISQEIAKAERIMSLKEEERKQTIELNRRKQCLREKQQEVQLRERRVAEKDQLIEKLTHEIREKSTLLLTKYNADNQRGKK